MTSNGVVPRQEGFVRAHERTAIGAIAGLVAGAIVKVFSVWQFAVLVGWIVTTGTILCWVWLDIGGLDAAGTAAFATRNDTSRDASRFVLLAACVVSLLAVFAALHKGGILGGGMQFALSGVAMLSVVAGWFTVHTLFMLHYANLYYADPQGGIDFPGLTTGPNYHDFAYLAFTIGMTFQVSDTSVSKPAIRFMVLRHALLSYLFATAIIAAAVNMLVNFIH